MNLAHPSNVDGSPADLDGFAVYFTPHVCSACFGRLMTRVDEVGVSTFICSNCGIIGIGSTITSGHMHPSNCACGLAAAGRDLKIRCTPNDGSFGVPSKIVARETGG